MSALFTKLWEDDSGVILSAELIIILTIAVLGMVVGLSCLQTAILSEFNDLALAFTGLNQSYGTPWFRGCNKFWGWGGRTSWVAGSYFIDVYDGCAGLQGGGYIGDICAQGYQLPVGNCPVTVDQRTQTALPSSDLCPSVQLQDVPSPSALTPTPAVKP